jgi:hypothetical protein
MCGNADFGRKRGLRTYPPIAIGCCFYHRYPNYQNVIRSIEKMATRYPNAVDVFIYFSAESDEQAKRLIDRLTFRCPELFTFTAGPNRIDEPKYRAPLSSEAPFIVTLDDDCVFADDTLSVLMDAYNANQLNGRGRCELAAVGWFGTELQNGRLLTPIEGRYALSHRETREVAYLGSCGALYSREVLSDERLRLENWPAFIGTASDAWISYLIQQHYRAPLFITSLDKQDLPEHGHSLWEDSISTQLPEIVQQLVSIGWGEPL